MKAKGTDESFFLGVISESAPTVIPKYKPSWFQLMLDNAFCDWNEVSPNKTVNRPLVTVMFSATGTAVVPEAVQIGVPPDDWLYKENLIEYVPSTTLTPLDDISLPW